MTEPTISIKIKERFWPNDQVYRDLALLNPTAVHVTNKGRLLLRISLDGDEVTLMTSDPHEHVVVVKELEPHLQRLIRFNLAAIGGGIIFFWPTDGFGSFWPEWTVLMAPSDAFEGPVIASRIPKEALGDAIDLDTFIRYNFLRVFEENIEHELLHANEAVDNAWCFALIVVTLIFLFIGLSLYYGPDWLKLLTIVLLLGMAWLVKEE